MPKKIDRGMANDIMDCVIAGTKKWARTRKQEEHAPASRSYRYAQMTQERRVQFKEAAWEIMPEAYAQASGDGRLPANARQIMYAARPYIQTQTGKALRDDYFTQTFCPITSMSTPVLIGMWSMTHVGISPSRMAGTASASAP